MQDLVLVQACTRREVKETSRVMGGGSSGWRKKSSTAFDLIGKIKKRMLPSCTWRGSIAQQHISRECCPAAYGVGTLSKSTFRSIVVHQHMEWGCCPTAPLEECYLTAHSEEASPGSALKGNVAGIKFRDRESPGSTLGGPPFHQSAYVKIWSWKSLMLTNRVQA